MSGPFAVASRRSTVLSCNAAVASSNPIASDVGLQILRNGGNAADAAVGIAATLNLVEPAMTGLGGDCFCLFYNSSTKQVQGINGSGKSPQQLTLGLLEKHGISAATHQKIPSDSSFSVMVPGAAAGWVDTVERFGSGKVTLREILQPAIELCEKGFPVHQWSSSLVNRSFGVLKENKFSHGNDLLLNGMPPKHGQVLKNKYLAEVLKKLASEGKKGFYESSVAESIVATVKEAGGCLSMEDMKNHESYFQDPISTLYKGVRVWEMPPNGQGLVALLGLNILEGMDIEKETRLSLPCLHKMIESTRLAFFDGVKYISDPLQEKIPLNQLLSKDYAASRRNSIQSDRVVKDLEGPSLGSGSDTVYFAVVDADGNACSFINSIYQAFGSGLVPEGCGFSLHNRGCNFSLNENHPNCVGPSKRSYHTIIPGMATHESNNELFACFGNMGGFMQPQGHMQLLVNLIDFEMAPQTAIDFPRFQVADFCGESPVIYVEESIPDDTINGLKKLGHNIKVVKGMDRSTFGRAQIIQPRFDDKGNKVLWSGSEMRGDGCAMGY